MKKKSTLNKKKHNTQNIIINEEKQNIGISPYGKKIILLSLLFLVIGFIVLKFTNAEATNLASIISPFIIIFSYIGIAIGILFNNEKNFKTKYYE